jgi:type VI secretion system protein ImpE
MSNVIQPERERDMSNREAGVLFREGRLDEAISAASAAVRHTPTDAAARVLLAEFLLFADDFPRAEAVLGAAATVDPSAALVVAEFRQLLRAAMARRQLMRDGRVPEFLGSPTAAQTLLLQALVSLRAGDQDKAASAAQAAEATRPAVSGTGNGRLFDDFRDVDDLVGGNLEVLTTTGKYFWIPIETVVSMEFQPPQRPRDLFWRRCSMMVRNGPEGDVYLPAVYDSGSDASDAHRLGRATHWSATAPVRGSGQRVFLVGDEAVAIHELGTVDFV